MHSQWRNSWELHSPKSKIGENLGFDPHKLQPTAVQEISQLVSWFHLSQVVGDLAFRSHPTKGLFEPFPFGVKLVRGFFQPIDVYGQSLLLSGRRLPVLHQKVVEAPAVCDTNDLDEVVGT